MSSSYATAADPLENSRAMPPILRAEHPAHASAVSWGAILAGAAAAAALSMILLMLGAGLGLSAISPWARSGATAAATEPAAAAPTAETTRIVLNSLRSGALPADDTRYLGQVVAQRTGLSQADAEKRVSDTYARMQTRLKEAETAARAAADKARKATIYATLWLFVSLLAGAFTASLAATWGGRQRDL